MRQGLVEVHGVRIPVDFIKGVDAVAVLQQIETKAPSLLSGTCAYVQPRVSARKREGELIGALAPSITRREERS